MKRQGAAPRFPPAGSDREILLALKRGDDDALRELHRRHVRAVYWFTYSLIRRRVDTEEVVQDTFLTLWNKARTVELVDDSVLPWLMTTARYLSLNRLRSLARHATFGQDMIDELAEPGMTPESRAALTQELETIEAALRRMSPMDQKLYRLCVVDALTYKEAASQLGVSHGTIRNRLSRVRKALRGELNIAEGTGWQP